MRTLSAGLLAGILAQQSGIRVHLLATITHPQLATPLRLASGGDRLTTDPLVYGVVSRGDTYLYIGMEISLPEEKEQSPPHARMIMSNVGREAIALVRSVVSPPTVKLELIRDDLPDIVEITWPAFDMGSCDYNADTINFDLIMDAFATEPYPGGSFTPSYFAGLYEG